MHYLSTKHMLLLHGLVLTQSGGIAGIRDIPGLQAAEALPKQAVFGGELYKTVYAKAAVYARTIMMNHPFLDGNKRTGMLTAITFLELNGYRFSLPSTQLDDFAVLLVTKKFSVEKIAAWFEKFSEKV